jgi:F0F1-type ATP synthase membrane subunit b/b'
MQRSLVSAFLLSVILGLGACSKEEPEGTAENIGKKVDEAVESAEEQVSESVEAAQKQAAETKAEVGAAMEEKGKEMKEEAEKSSH